MIGFDPNYDWLGILSSICNSSAAGPLAESNR
jgi:hypothetical protein